ncbi:MAG: peptidoglycan-binding domain-containing protein [Glaciecola sp.]
MRILISFCLTICMSATLVSAKSLDVRQAQKMLNQLGYTAGSVDGIAGKNTNRAMQNFMTSVGRTFDGSIDSEEVNLLSEASGIEVYAGPYRLRDAYTAQENLPLYYTAQGARWNGKHDCWYYWRENASGSPLDHLEKTTSCFVGKYFDAYAREPVNLDFNGDGIRDKIIIGVPKPSNIASTPENYGKLSDWELTQKGKCLNDQGVMQKNVCDVIPRQPLFFEGRSDGTFVLRENLLIDNRANAGMIYAHQVVPADFNGDGVLDMYITDHGDDQHPHYRGEAGSYFLSQPDGTWLESSETHMLHRGKVWTAFNHGVTAGDIDSDGDIDIIETMIDNKKADGLWCRINDGTGKMTMKACGGGKDGWGVQVGDLDNDGCLDTVQVGGRAHFNGVSWGNCKGQFRRGPKLNQHANWSKQDDPKIYGEVLESWLWDLDNDGDLDIINNHVGYLYVGAAISIHENLGNRKFQEVAFIEYNKRPSEERAVQNCHNQSEGNNCNVYLQWMDFIDVDKDGLYELVFSANAAHNNRVYIANKFEWQITGMIVRNKGGMQFSWEPKDNYAAKYSKWAKHRL